MIQLPTSRCAATTTACPSIRNLAATGDLRMTAVQGLCETYPIQMKYKQPSLELRAFCANNLFTSQRKMKIWQCWILEMSEMLAMLAMLFTRILVQEVHAEHFVRSRGRRV